VIHAWIDAALAAEAIPLFAVDKDNLDAVCALFGAEVRRWCTAHAFAGENGRFVLVPGKDGAPAAVLAGCDRRDALFCLASLPLRRKATTRSMRAGSHSMRRRPRWAGRSAATSSCAIASRCASRRDWSSMRTSRQPAPR